MDEAMITPGPAQDPYRLVGLTLTGKYRLVGYVGSGGMGAVYRALVTDSGRRVAVKILKPDVVANDRDCAPLFEQEVEAVRCLEHPNIVRLFDSGNDQGISFMVMEWLDGQTLEEVVSVGRLSLERVDRILAQVCDALEAAHAERIIHLDLKPGNIFLLSDGRPDDFVKVIDFGMSRVLTRDSGTTVTKFGGTIQYCAPEQFGGKVSGRSDIYGLGATLYHLLTGLVPFGTSYIYAKMHGDQLPPLPAIRGVRPDVPPAVERVVKRALSRDPDERQQSARQLYEDFHRAACGATATTRRFPWPALSRPSFRITVPPKTSFTLWLSLSLATLSWLAAGVVLFNFAFDRPVSVRNGSDVYPPPGPEVNTSRPVPPDANRKSQRARPTDTAAQPDTPGSPVARMGTPVVPSSAVEPAETRTGPRLSPVLDLDFARDVPPQPGSVVLGREFIERGTIFVPPSDETAPELDPRRTASSANPRDEEQRLMALVNEQRRRRGLQPLSLDGELSKVARQHAQGMARDGYFNHRDRGGKDVTARAKEVGLTDWKALTENIAYNQGFDDPTGFAVERWMISQKHRENILNREFTHAGVGIARTNDGTYYFTQVLMKR
ncbi:MAG: protein kinase [Pyrinomonadaceae bacterium]